MSSWPADARRRGGIRCQARPSSHADALLDLALSARAGRVLAVTDVDLDAGDLNFVFGMAESSGQACVISLSGSILTPTRSAFAGAL
ncbi:MAG TPA: hypothetical protein VG758_13365 [Hyphomicrobiaceae bacterium]|jgi:predicted Zn-dependent protease|nr:hypothetical protein [Hyphomicrobiaceae bacterium]